MHRSESRSPNTPAASSSVQMTGDPVRSLPDDELSRSWGHSQSIVPKSAWGKSRHVGLQKRPPKFLPPRRQTVGHIMESWVIAVGDFV